MSNEKEILYDYNVSSKKNGDTPQTESPLDRFRKNPDVKIILNALAWITLIVISVMIANFSFDCDVLNTLLGKVGIALGIITGAIRIYQGKGDLENAIGFAKVHWIIIFILLPLVTGIFGYSWWHLMAAKNEKFQKNELIKAESDRRQGIEAEVVREFTIANRKFSVGDIVPMVVINGSIKEKSDGLNKLAWIYFYDTSTNKIVEMPVSLDYIVPRPKTVFYNGHYKNFDQSGKVMTVTFTTNEIVSVLDDFKIGQKLIITGAPEGELQWPDNSNSSKLYNVPQGTIFTNQEQNSLLLKYKAGGKIIIKFI